MAFEQPLSTAEILDRLRGGDQEAARILFDRYTFRLTALVRARLSRRLSRRIDPEDVIQSAWRSFFVGARENRWAAAGDEFWPLLSAMTLNKLSRQIARQSAQRRNVATDQSFDQTSEAALAASKDAPSPDDVAELSDHLEVMLDGLEPLAREAILLRLWGHDTDQIAHWTGSSRRTIRRIIETAKDYLAKRAVTNHDGGRLDLAAYRILLKPRDDRLQQAAPLVEELRSPPGRSFEFSDLLLRQMIGQGTLGKVYRAMTRADGRPVAVKFLKKRLWSDDRAVVSLWRETDAVSAVAHHGIIQHLGRGRTPTGTPFLVMELIEGRDLDGWIEAERPPMEARLHRVAELARALNAAHAAGVIHGDISPANVLIAGCRTVLTDFGFAAIGTRPAAMLGGTLLFAAPEQLSSAFGSVGPWTDVYSIGALIRAICGDEPCATPPDVDTAIAGIVSASEMQIGADSAIPAELQSLISECTQFDCALRPAMASVGTRLSKLASSTYGEAAATFEGSPAG